MMLLQEEITKFQCPHEAQESHEAKVLLLDADREYSATRRRNETEEARGERYAYYDKRRSEETDEA